VRNRPNPFAGTTEIRFGLPTAQRIALRVYNIQGRLVKTLAEGAYPRGYHTVMGVSVAAAAAGLAEAGANAVGSNCGNGIEHMIEIARAFRAVTALPIVIQPNAGLPRTSGTETVYDETPAFMAGKAAVLLDLGVSVIGGCCGTTPEHIRALRATIDGRSA